MPFDREKFQEFIQNKFYEWRGRTDRKWSDFADYVGVPQQTMASWKNGYLKRIPDLENISKLAVRFGNETYEALGISSFNESGLLQNLPRVVKTRFESAINEWEIFIENQSLDPNSDQAIVFVKEIFSHHGIILTYDDE